MKARLGIVAVGKEKIGCVLVCAIELSLRNRRNLRLARRRPGILLDFLSASGREFLLVGTKSDRLSNNQLHTALRTLADEYPSARLLPYSAKTGTGREALWQQIRQAARGRRSS